MGGNPLASTLEINNIIFVTLYNIQTFSSVMADIVCVCVCGGGGGGGEGGE